MEVLEQAVKEVAETGTLEFPARRKLWEAMGPYEERPEDDPIPRTRTEPLKKRAELALACARKVGRIWCAYNHRSHCRLECLGDSPGVWGVRRLPHL